jgi:hypothetical protein
MGTDTSTGGVSLPSSGLAVSSEGEVVMTVSCRNDA